MSCEYDNGYGCTSIGDVSEWGTKPQCEGVTCSWVDDGPRSVYHSVLDNVQSFRDPVERAAARDALAQAMRLHGVTRLAPAMEEPHGDSFEDVDGVLYPYVF